MIAHSKTLLRILLFVLLVPSHIGASQKQTFRKQPAPAPKLVQEKKMEPKKTSTSWWKNPYVYVASAGLVLSAAAATYLGIQLSKSEPKKVEPVKTTDKIEAIAEMPSPEQEQELANKSALELYRNHVNEIGTASRQNLAQFEELVFGKLYDLINTPAYNFDPEKSVLNNVMVEMGQFLRSNYFTLWQTINNEEEPQARQELLNTELSTNLNFKINYLGKLNELYIQAIEESGSTEMKKDLVKFLSKNFIMK